MLKRIGLLVLVLAALALAGHVVSGRREEGRQEDGHARFRAADLLRCSGQDDGAERPLSRSHQQASVDKYPLVV